AGNGPGEKSAGLIAASNVGTDAFWTGHPLAQANLYAYGRLAWDTKIEASEILASWIQQTFGGQEFPALHSMLMRSWKTYENYTAPLGIGFMVNPGHHYGPS